MDLQASIATINGAKQGIASTLANSATPDQREFWTQGYTTVPSLAKAYAQHETFWMGQPGDVLQAMQKYQADLQWAMNLLDSLGFAIDQQDKSSANVLDKFDIAKHAGGIGGFACFQPRDNEPFKNLNYAAPVTVAEVSTPLEALIGMFTSSDAAPLASAERWSQAATRLEATAHTLHSISGDLARSNRGHAFDAVRNALEDFVKRGHNIAANAALMAESAGQFPGVRQLNLGELAVIKARVDGMTFATQAGRLLHERGEVARFVSTHLQPSLELLKPPVHNFGVPVVGHNGGGGVNITSFNTTGPAEAFQAINGNVAPAAANNVQELGAQTADAVTDAGRGNTAANAPATGNASPAAGEHIPASQQQVAPAGASPAAPASPGVAPAGAQLPANTSAHTAGMPGGAPTNATAPGLDLPGANQRTAGGNPSAGGAQPARPALPTTGTNRSHGQAPLPRGGSAPHGTGTHNALRNAPGIGGAEGTGERAGNRNQGYGTHGTAGQGRVPRPTVVRPELPAAHPENLRNGAAGRGLHGVGAPGTPNAAPNTGMHGTGHGYSSTATPQAEQAAAQNNQRGRGFYGGMAPGARGGANTGRQVKPGAGQWASSVSEYFKRQFLGAKPRTTKKVISR